MRREDDDGCAWLHPLEKIDDILVGHADAAGKDSLADVFWLVGAMDAVQGVLAALVKVVRCAHGTGRDRSRPVSRRLSLGLEGLVSKRRDRPYQAGRSKHWVKVKNRKHPAMSRVIEAFA
jgi:hypothetical protein